MSADLAINLVADTSDWRNGFESAGNVVDSFSGQVDNGISHVVASGSRIGEFANAASSQLRGLNAGLQLVGLGGSSVAKAAANMSGLTAAIGASAGAFSALRSNVSVVQKLTSILSATAKGAMFATIALRGISFVMSRYGADTAKVDALRASISRIGLAATASVAGIKALSFSFSAMSAVAMAPIRLVTAGINGIRSAAGMAAGAVSRIGGSGIALASSMTQVFGSSDESAQQFATGLSVVGSALAIGGPLAAGAIGVGYLLKSVFDTEPEGGPLHTSLEVITTKISEISAAFMEMANESVSKATEALWTFGETGTFNIDTLREAFFPVTDAIRSDFVPSAIDGINTVATMFGLATLDMSTGWGWWIKDSTDALAEFVENIDLYFQIAQQYISLWASNRILEFEDLWTNLGTGLDWFGEHWKEVLLDVGNLYTTFISNMITNFSNGFQAIVDFAKGKGFKFEMVGALDGFESSIKEMPDFVKQELAQTSPELEELYKKLGERQREAIDRAMKPEATSDEVVFAEGSGGEEDEPSKKKKGKNFATAALRDSKEAFSAIVNAQTRGVDPAVAATKEVVTEVKKLNQNVVKLGKSGPSHPGPVLGKGAL